jgi:hypothetical protein
VSIRSVPYPGVGATLRLPRPLWDEALTIIDNYGRRGRGHEALVYIAGGVCGGDLVATAVYILDHSAQGDRVIVTPEEARWLLQELRRRDEKLLAQLHSHRHESCHSSGDDAHSASFHAGFLSIVVPRFGRGVSNLTDCTVAEYSGGRFIEIAPDQVPNRLRIMESVVHRKLGMTKEGPWRALMRKLKLTGRRAR